MDLKTLFICYSANLVFISVLLGVLWRQNRRYFKGLHLWFFALVMVAAGFVLTTMRNILPDAISVVVADSLTMGSFTVILRGLEIFTAYKKANKFSAIILAVTVFLFIVYTYIRPDISMRVMIMSAAIPVTTTYTGTMLLFRIDEKLRPVAKWVGIIFYVLSGLFILRTLSVFFHPYSGEQDLFTGPLSDGIFILLLTLLTIGYTYALTMMVSKRYSMELHEKNGLLIESQKRLSSSLHEKEALLRELYHRTKNNMQVIIALLDAQSRNSGDAKFKTLVDEAKNRIQSMSMVHQKLYDAKDLSKLNLKEYITEFSQILMADLCDYSSAINIEYDLDEVEITIDLAIPCALVLNEILSNAFRHAFPGQTNGSVGISLRKEKNIVIKVTDNGNGLPKDLNLNQSTSLGVLNARIITENQLGGTIMFEKVNPGVCCTVIFPDKY